jgi:hypothetical protein
VTDVPPPGVLPGTSLQWHIAAGWCAVATLFWHMLGYDLVSTAVVLLGHPAPPPLQDLSLSDMATIIGLPAAGHLVQRNKGTDQ